MTAFLKDTFTDTANVLLENHTPDVGGAWVAHTLFAGSSAEISTNNDVKSNHAGNNVYYNAADPGSADYRVDQALVIDSNDGSQVAVMARLQSGALSWAYLYYDHPTTSWNLKTAIGGSFELTAGPSTATYANGTTVIASIECKGTTIYGYVNGVLILTLTGTALTAKGFAGLLIGPNVQTDSTGIHVDNIVAYAVAPVAVTNSNLAFSLQNWYSDGAGGMQANNIKGSSTFAVTNNPGASLKFAATTPANGWIAVDLDTSIFTGINAARCPQICYRKDNGAFTTALLVQASGTTRIYIDPLTSAGTHQYEIFYQNSCVDGGGALDGDRWTNLTTDALAVKITGVESDGQTTLSAPSLLSQTMVMFSDSNGEGANVLDGTNVIANRDATQSFSYLFAKAFEAELGNISFGGQGYEIGGAQNVPVFSLAYDKYSAGHNRDYTNQPTYVAVQMGTNGSTTADDVFTMAGNLRSKYPGAYILFLQTPAMTAQSAIQTGVANYKVANPTDKRITFVSAGRSFINGLTSVDNLHLNGLRGHPEYAASMAQEARLAIDAASPTPRVGQVIGYLYTRDGQGNILTSQVVSFQLTDPLSNTDAWRTSKFNVTSDGTTGLVSVQLLQNAKYRMSTSSGQVDFTTGTSSPFALPEVLGL